MGRLNWLRKIMYGRYGGDQLNNALMVLFLVLYLLSGLLRNRLLRVLALAVLLWSFYRLMSRKIDKRRAENAHFIELARPVLERIRAHRCRSRDKDHIYFKCPSCGQQLRAPKGLGKISITCRNCGATFEENT